MSDERCLSHGSIIAGYARAITFAQAGRRFRFDLRFLAIRGAGFTSLLRELGWLAVAPHPLEESLSRASGASG